MQNKEDMGGYMGTFVFILGLVFGSFFNVCIYRIPRGESIVSPPSHCTYCNNRLKFYDMIPVLSYIFLRGRCRYCKEKISIKYPVIELLTGFSFLLIYLRYGISLNFFKYTVLTGFMIVIGFIDFYTTDVYTSSIIAGMIFGSIFIIINIFLGHNFMDCIFGAMFGFAVIGLIILISKGGMGAGDAEIAGLIGIFLGLKLTVTALSLSIIIGGLTGIILVILKKKSMKDYFAFGPFMSIGAYIAILYGNEIANWYLSKFML